MQCRACVAWYYRTDFSPLPAACCGLVRDLPKEEPQSLKRPNSALPALRYPLCATRWGGWIMRSKIEAIYGPFLNEAGGGDVPKGAPVLVFILKPDQR